MSLFRKLFGGSQDDAQREKLVPLLNGIVQPLQHGAVQQIGDAVNHIQDGNSQGRLMLLMMHVCLASILHRLDRENARQSCLSSSFKDFAISQWDRPPNMTIDAVHKLFAYSQQELGDKLVNPNDDQLVDLGLTLLSIAVPDQQQFTTGAALAWGQAAHACWRHASAITDKVMET